MRHLMHRCCCGETPQTIQPREQRLSHINCVYVRMSKRDQRKMSSAFQKPPLRKARSSMTPPTMCGSASSCLAAVKTASRWLASKDAGKTLARQCKQLTITRYEYLLLAHRHFAPIMTTGTPSCDTVELMPLPAEPFENKAMRWWKWGEVGVR